MRNSIVNRLAALEEHGTDWISKLAIIDYVGIDDYDNGDWDEVFFDDLVTVVRHVESGEVRGYYADRRTHEEMIAQGGNPEYL